ncbi:LAMI_0B05798g1_1 [Lachancea mirantina]|uniref:LAMI_0B05798g1_1 n=1 Tax=Lachancea mirantina TaxID=1230905 RepID=A0A1G4IW80_9SACH|nr:LAMI_0B05798g1_1 [Lachancea mirantina]
MVVHNPNNWHWVDKNCIEWARQYMRSKLVGLSSNEKTGKHAEIASVSAVEGDCEVSQRKGKVISLFDLKVVMMLKGFVGEEPFEGSITVPEVAFDSQPDDYQFEISIYKETAQLSEVKPVIRSELIPKLRDVFSGFAHDLLVTHGDDIQVPESQVQSQFTRANQKSLSQGGATKSEPKSIAKSSTATATSSSGAAGPQSVANSSSTAPKYNTTTLHLEPTFNVPAIELYNTFLDKQRIMAWSRSHLICASSSPRIEKGDEFTLFGGNVTSKLEQCEPGKKLVFAWRLNEWQSGHFSVMTMNLHESKDYHETKLQVTWSGVPVGEEDKVRGNFEEYYIRSIKITFGFGAVL